MGGLELRDLTVRYGDREVLHGLSLTVPAGQQVALVGPNGSGKTTLLRALAGIAPVVRGSAVPATGLTRREIARHVAFLPQEEHWEFAFSVDEVVR